MEPRPRTCPKPSHSKPLRQRRTAGHKALNRSQLKILLKCRKIKNVDSIPLIAEDASISSGTAHVVLARPRNPASYIILLEASRRLASSNCNGWYGSAGGAIGATTVRRFAFSWWRLAPDASLPVGHRLSGLWISAASEMSNDPSPTTNAASETRVMRKPIVVVIIGVSGSGKTTVAAMLARRLHWRFEEGDNLHSAANIAKISHGIALTDEDRMPWLRMIAAVTASSIAQRQIGVVACSALKRAYRQIIIRGNRAVRLVYLRGSRELVM